MSKVVGAIFLAVGLLIASVAGYFAWTTQDLLRNGIHSSAKVVEMRKPQFSRYSLPVVEFETPDHKTITAICKTGTNPPTHKVNDSVTVIYRAASPEDIRLNEPIELWLVPWLLAGIAWLFVMIGGSMLFFAFKKRRRDRNV